MRILLFSEAPERFSADKDTTRAIMEYGHAHGALWYVADKTDLRWRDGRLWADVRTVTAMRPQAAADWIDLSAPACVPVIDFDLILVRNDPPVDLAYQRMCQLLELVADDVPVLNPPGALLRHNEKTSALRFARFMPDTEVAYIDNVDDTSNFSTTHGVYKSLDSLGGEGVAKIPGNSTEARQLRSALARGPDHQATADYLMAQRWIEGVEKGDKRVILVEGTFAGVVLRVPQPGEFRGNIHMGGRVEETVLTVEEAALVRRVGAWLRSENIALCGLDLVNGWLTEINITSPTGFREIERLSHDRPTACFWQYIEQRVRYG